MSKSIVIRARTGPYIRRLRASSRYLLRGKSVQRITNGLAISPVSPDGLRLTGLLYPSTANDGPGLVMVHGSDPLGQLHSFYIALASALQGSGITVLTLNLRGYPGSDLPQDDNGFGLNFLVGDISAGISALSDLSQVDGQKIAVYGHSYGAGLIIPACNAERRIWKAIIHSPPDWNERRITGENAPEAALFYERFWRYMTIGRPVSYSVFQQLYRDIDIMNQWPLLNENHAPLLLLSGEEESVSMRSFMQAIAEKIPPPRDYVTVPKADHYANCGSIGKWLVIDHRVVATFASAIRKWLLIQ